MATVILKATESCNSNCYYCDVVRKSTGGGSMSPEMLETVFSRANEYLSANRAERLEILWHGGEPLLLGPEYYRHAKELQQRLCPDTEPRIRHAMQTNLTLFTDEFVEPFKSLGIDAVGTSFDPEPHMRGPGEEIDTDWYNRHWLRATGVLERSGIGWGLIYVVTRRSIEKPLDIFHYLTNLVPGGGFNMNPVLIYDDERTDVAISPDEYVEYLGAIFPIWWAHRDRYSHVEPFHSLVETVVHRRVSLGCVDSGSCTYHHINIAPSGETSQCGRSDDWGLLQYGNIRDMSFDEILANRKRDELEVRVKKLGQDDCADCRFWGLCHGGCPLDAYSQHQSFMHKSEWCDAKRGFMERFFEPVTGVRYDSYADGRHLQGAMSAVGADHSEG